MTTIASTLLLICIVSALLLVLCALEWLLEKVFGFSGQAEEQELAPYQPSQAELNEMADQNDIR